MTVLVLSIVGVISFSMMVFVDVGYNIPAVSYTAKYILFHYIDLNGIYLSQVAFPIAVLTTLGLTAYRIDWGLAPALRWALRAFTFPAITILQVGILIFDSREIALYATKFVPWSLGGIWVVSNWFLLIVSAFLFFATGQRSSFKQRTIEERGRRT
ncbi:MAG: hypothetical protein ACLQEQ_00410 [Nitrososphaerales archaeon]